MEKEEEKKKTKLIKSTNHNFTILLLAAISYIILDKTGVLDSITSSNKETETKIQQKKLTLRVMTRVAQDN